MKLIGDNRNVPGSAMYFFALAEIRSALATSHSTTGKNPLQTWDNLLAGATARGSVGFIMMPITVVKIRYEVSEMLSDICSVDMMRCIKVWWGWQFSLILRFDCRATSTTTRAWRRLLVPLSKMTVYAVYLLVMVLRLSAMHHLLVYTSFSTNSAKRLLMVSVTR